jgi:hypothetical protein
VTPAIGADDLRARYREPSDLVRRKDVGHLDAGARRYIAASPFVVVASGAAGGCDASR